jgi:hypothetical protein
MWDGRRESSQETSRGKFSRNQGELTNSINSKWCLDVLLKELLV